MLCSGRLCQLRVFPPPSNLQCYLQALQPESQAFNLLHLHLQLWALNSHSNMSLCLWLCPILKLKCHSVRVNICSYWTDIVYSLYKAYINIIVNVSLLKYCKSLQINITNIMLTDSFFFFFLQYCDNFILWIELCSVVLTLWPLSPLPSVSHLALRCRKARANTGLTLHSGEQVSKCPLENPFSLHKLLR